MDWFILALLSPVLIAFSNIADKFMFNRYIKNPYSYQIISEIGLIPVLIIFFFFVNLSFSIFSIISFLFGTVLVLVYFLYNKSMIKEEASRVVALSYLQPIFVLIFAFLLLSEAVSFLNILGIFLLVSSAILVSYKKVKKKFSLTSSVVKMMLAFSIILSLAMVVARWALSSISPYQFLFWALLGGQAPVYFLLFLKNIRKSFLDEGRKMWIKGWLIKFVGSSVYMVGIVFLYVAISIHNVALVTAVSSSQPFFVFLYALILSVLAPKILKEDLGKENIAMKIISFVLIALGSWLIVT